MPKKWQEVTDALSKIEVIANPHNEPVTINGCSEGLQCIGVGTDAAVFRYIHMPAFAFKLYADEKLSQKENEKKVYEQLSESPYFSTFYGAEARFLVLQFEQGTTLYDCLLQGIPIPKQAIQDVEDARTYVREKGLNPRDIHLKNILLQSGRAKILDVSEYMQPGNDYRWEHLKKGYEQYYHLIAGRPIPFWLMNTIRKWYNQRSGNSFIFDDFMKKVAQLTMFRR